jgi:hypothetical protein
MQMQHMKAAGDVITHMRDLLQLYGGQSLDMMVVQDFSAIQKSCECVYSEQGIDAYTR